MRDTITTGLDVEFLVLVVITVVVDAMVARVINVWLCFYCLVAWTPLADLGQSEATRAAKPQESFTVIFLAPPSSYLFHISTTY